MDEKKNAKGLAIVIVILVILVMALSGYIGYDKFLKKDSTNITEENSENETNTKNEIQNTEENENSKEYIKTRICTGIYSGSAAVSQDAQTGEYEKGILTIELKANGTYELKKDNTINSLGSYTIIDNALLLTTSPSTCGPGIDCSAKYSEYLNISEDCSKISWGYGSYFFDPDFTLNKQN